MLLRRRHTERPRPEVFDRLSFFTFDPHDDFDYRYPVAALRRVNGFAHRSVGDLMTVAVDEEAPLSVLGYCITSAITDSRFAAPTVEIQEICVDKSLRGWHLGSAVIYQALVSRPEHVLETVVISPDKSVRQSCQRLGFEAVTKDTLATHASVVIQLAMAEAQAGLGVSMCPNESF